ncbi:MAG: RNA polymerase sigma factor [Lachnospira sp.]
MNKQNNDLIYAQFHDKVTCFVRSKISNQTEAEDIVQTVFLKIFSNLDKYDEKKASLSTWIYTITRNTVYDYLKEKRNHPMLELLENTVESEDGADEIIINSEMLKELACALEKLPQNERDVIILVYYHEKRKTEVAEILGISYGQLRYLHDKAISQLKQML